MLGYVQLDHRVRILGERVEQAGGSGQLCGALV